MGSWQFWKCMPWPAEDGCCCMVVLFGGAAMMGICWLMVEGGALGLKCSRGLVLRTFVSLWWDGLNSLGLRKQLDMPLAWPVLWALSLCWEREALLGRVSWLKEPGVWWTPKAVDQFLTPPAWLCWWLWSIELGCCWLAAICFSCSACDISGHAGRPREGPPVGTWTRCPEVMCEVDKLVLAMEKEGPVEAGLSCGELPVAWLKSGEYSVLIGLSRWIQGGATPAELGRPRPRPKSWSCFNIFSSSRSLSDGTVLVSSSNKSWSSGSICPLTSSLKSNVNMAGSVDDWPQVWTSVGSFFISLRVMLNKSLLIPWGIMKVSFLRRMLPWVASPTNLWVCPEAKAQEPDRKELGSMRRRLKSDPDAPQERPFCLDVYPGDCASIFLRSPSWKCKECKVSEAFYWSQLVLQVRWKKKCLNRLFDWQLKGYCSTDLIKGIQKPYASFLQPKWTNVQPNWETRAHNVTRPSLSN